MEYQSLDCLPNEILHHILGYLSIKEKISLERVCTKWRAMLWSLYGYHKSLRINCNPSANLYNGCISSKHMDVRGIVSLVSREDTFWSFHSWQTLNEDFLWPILKRCANIRSIHLENSYVNSESMLWMIDMCPRLECLSLIEIYGLCSFEWSHLAYRLMGRLKHFSFSDSHNTKLENLSPIMTSLKELQLIHLESPLDPLLSYLGPNLNKLTIKYCYSTTCLDIVEALATGSGKNIKQLIIVDPWVEDEVEALLYACRELRNLKLMTIGFGTITENIRPIYTFRNSRELDINADLNRWHSIRGSTLTTIEALVLNAYFSAIHLSDLPLMFPNLQSLVLYFDCECPQRIAVYVFFSKCDICFHRIFTYVTPIESLTYLSLNNAVFHRNTNRFQYIAVQ